MSAGHDEPLKFVHQLGQQEKRLGVLLHGVLHHLLAQMMNVLSAELQGISHGLNGAPELVHAALLDEVRVPAEGPVMERSSGGVDHGTPMLTVGGGADPLLACGARSCRRTGCREGSGRTQPHRRRSPARSGNVPGASSCGCLSVQDGGAGEAETVDGRDWGRGAGVVITAAASSAAASSTAAFGAL